VFSSFHKICCLEILKALKNADFLLSLINLHSYFVQEDQIKEHEKDRKCSRYGRGVKCILIVLGELAGKRLPGRLRRG
jgi:hypothetical protein